MNKLHEGNLLVLDPDYNLNEPYIPGNFRSDSIDNNDVNQVSNEALKYYSNVLSFQEQNELIQKYKNQGSKRHKKGQDDYNEFLDILKGAT